MLATLALCLQVPVSTVYLNATLIDGNGGAPIEKAWVSVDRNVILATGVGTPPTGNKVDCRGKWIIPGLFDMHTHVDDPELVEVKPKREEKEQWLPLFVMMGVTGIREMAGDLALLQDFRARIKTKTLLGPRIWCGGPLVDGPKPMWPESIAASTPEEGRAVVRDLKSKGADFVKVYSLVPRDAFFAICDEAKKVGIPVCGHVPVSVTNQEAAEAGLNSIEHLLQIEREVADPALVTEFRKDLPADIDRYARYKANEEIYERAFSEGRAIELIGTFKQKGTWIDPTLIVAWENSHFDARDTRMTARLPFIPAYVREWWDPEKNVHLRDQTGDLRAGQQTLYRIYKRLIPLLKRAGVPLLTGSDMGGNPHCFAGWGVHDEMERLVDAGLTPMEAIVAATSNPAKYLRAFDKLGSVEKGKFADFVVLDADPIKDIKNTQRVFAVVYDGHYYGPTDLKALWAKQKAAVAKRL